MSQKKLIIALDFASLDDVKNIVKNIDPDQSMVKVGLQLYVSEGRKVLDYLSEKGFEIFLDLKLHDIPNTVEKGIEAISKLNPYFTTIHLSGGDEMQKIAAKDKGNIKILGVSILTSLDSEQTKKYYYNKKVEDIVYNFAKNALDNGLDGVVCSPKEIKIIKKATQNKLLIVTPGIRPLDYNDSFDDQKRTMSPKEALEVGANYLVIGRPITKAPDPLDVLKNINSSLE